MFESQHPPPVVPKAWFKSRELPNGLFVWQGHAHGTFMPESIGVAAIVTEFLMLYYFLKCRN